jgi:hypothetical protein
MSSISQSISRISRRWASLISTASSTDAHVVDVEPLGAGDRQRVVRDHRHA